MKPPQKWGDGMAVNTGHLLQAIAGGNDVFGALF